jgi:hypothetical protein
VALIQSSNQQQKEEPLQKSENCRLIHFNLRKYDRIGRSASFNVLLIQSILK